MLVLVLLTLHAHSAHISWSHSPTRSLYPRMRVHNTHIITYRHRAQSHMYTCTQHSLYAIVLASFTRSHEHAAHVLLMRDNTRMCYCRRKHTLSLTWICAAGFHPAIASELLKWLSKIIVNN